MKKRRLLVMIATVLFGTVFLCAQDITPATGGKAFVYIGALSSIPATCKQGTLSFITDATAGQQIYECSATNVWTQQLNSGVGGASTALDNLASVSINTALLFQSAKDIGSAAKPAEFLFLYGAGTYGTTSLKFTGTPTGARVWTFQDTTDTVVGLATTDTLTNKTLTTPTIGSFTNATHNHSNAAGGGTLALGTAITNLSGAVVTLGSSVTTPGKADVLDAVNFCADAGANDTYACNLSPAITGYVTGTHYRFKAATANTGAATINFNAVGALTIKKAAGGITTDLADNDIRVGQWVDGVYDGTNFQMQSTLGNAASGSGTPGGSDTQVQFDDGGSFGGNAGLTFSKTNKLLTLTGSATTSASDVFTCTDTTNNTGTAYCIAGITTSGSALNGLKLNRGSSGTGSRALSIQDNSVEKAYFDFAGNLTAASVTFTNFLSSTILDANGKPFLASSATASAVDSVTITNAATANPATVNISGTGSDSNINLGIIPKGTGKVNIGSTNATMDTSGNLVVVGCTGCGSGSTAGSAIIMQGNFLTVPGSTTTYGNIAGVITGLTTEANAQSLIPSSCTVNAAYVDFRQPQPSGGSHSWTLRDSTSAADTTVVVTQTASGAAAILGDTTHHPVLTAGHEYVWKIVNGSGSTSSAVYSAAIQCN